MRFAPINLFIGFAGGADTSFEALHKPEAEAALVLPRPFTQRALHTSLGQGTIAVGDFTHMLLLALTRR